MSNEIITPSQVMKAIAHAINLGEKAAEKKAKKIEEELRENKDKLSEEELEKKIKKELSKITNEDKFGDDAFKFDPKKFRPGNAGVRYFDFQVLKQRSLEEWEYIPINLKFKNLTTKSRIRAIADRKYPGVQLQFAHDAKYTTKLDKKDSDGNDIIINEEYSKVKILICRAFGRITNKLLENKKLYADNTKLCYPIQFKRKIGDTGEKVKLEEPIIRVAIKFVSEKIDKIDKKDIKKEKEIKPTDKPRCDLYDIDKPILATNPNYRKDGFNFEPLKYVVDGVSHDINYENIGNVILPGSKISGLNNMSITISNMGISLTSSISVGIVKKSEGYKPDPSKIFNSEEIKSFIEAETEIIEEPESKESISVKKSNQINSEIFDKLTEEAAEDPKPETTSENSGSGSESDKEKNKKSKKTKKDKKSEKKEEEDDGF